MCSFLKLLLLVSCFILNYSAFSQVIFTSSNLPIVVINTNYMTIRDDPKIFADMGIIWNGIDKRNSVNDPKNNYYGKIAIEIRGSSSQMFPKKSYGFETKSNEFLDVDVPLLDLPAENDWILYAPYTDKTMIRDVLTYTIDASLGHYSPRCRFVELVLNGNYQGVYVLMEKIKRNKNRVDIAKLTTLDNSGTDLTGGYIIKIDKLTGGGGEGWNSDFSNTVGRTYYQYDYPKAKEITTTQKGYIQAYVKSFENALYFEKFSGPGSYSEFMDEPSFIDFMIINELSKNVDGYRLSSYLYKGKNGKLNCGPIWDFNLTYGNANYHNGWQTSGMQYQANLGNDYWQNPFWWNKLIRNPVYVTNLKKRWTTLRKKELSNQRVNFLADSLVNLLAEAQVRNYHQWPILGKYVWPNYYVGSTYDSEVSWLKSWITSRLMYLDQMWPYDFTNSDLYTISSSAEVYPNPFQDHLNVQFTSDIAGKVSAELINSVGNRVFQDEITLNKGLVTIRDASFQHLQSGMYLLKIFKNNEVLLVKKVVKQAN